MELISVDQEETLVSEYASDGRWVIFIHQDELNQAKLLIDTGTPDILKCSVSYRGIFSNQSTF